MRACLLFCLWCLMFSAFAASNGSSDSSINTAALNIEQRYFSKVPLSESVVQQAPGGIYKDGKGRLWLVYTDFILQVAGQTVTRLEIPSFDNKPFVQSLYPNIVEFKGMIIISWKDRLLSYDPLSQRLLPFHEQDFVTKNKRDIILDLDVDASGRLWVTTAMEVLTLTSAADNFTAFAIDQQYLVFEDYALMSLEADAFGDVWLASYGLGLLRIDGTSLTIKQQLLDVGPDNPLEHEYFFSFKQYDADTALVGTGRGLYRFSQAQQSFTRLFPQQIKSFTADINIIGDGNTDSTVVLLANEKLFMLKDDLSRVLAISAPQHFTEPMNDYIAPTLFIDDESVHWLSVKDVGLFRYAPSLSKLDTVKLSVDGSADNNLSQLLRLSDRRYGVAGIYGGGILRDEGDRLISDHTIDPPVFTIAEGPRGTLWFGGRKQLIKQNPDGVVEVATNDNDKVITGDYLSSYHDGQNHLWLIDDVKGLSVYDSKSESEIPVNRFNISDELRQDSLFVSGDAQRGIVWLVSKSTLQRIVPSDPQNNRSILTLDDSQSKISHVQRRGDELLLFHHNRQLSVIDLLSQQWRKIELPVDNVGCVIMQAGDYWLAQRNGGLFRWQPDSSTLLGFDSFDGLPYGGLNGKVCEKIGERLLFSGLSGVVSPRKTLHFNTIKPTLQVTHVTTPQGLMALTGTPLTLDAGQFPLSIGFINSSLSSPAQNRLRYRLLGLNEQWVERDDAAGQLTFESLGIGHYQLQIQGSNNDGMMSDLAVMDFEVLPPLWLTWWAKLGYILLLLTVFYRLHLMRIKIMQQREEKLEQVVALRTEELKQQKNRVEQLLDFKEQEFVNVSHELRTPLTLVSGPLKQALQACTETDVQRLLQMANRNSARLLRMVEQLLQLERFRLQKVLDKTLQPISTYVQVISESFYLPLSNKAQVLTLTHNDPCEILFVADAFEKILINLISNAIKYTPRKGHIEVSSVVVGDTLILTVNDNGIGIKPADQTQIFNKFFRVMDESSEKVTGAGVGLALVKELVEAHGGVIEIHSVAGEGSEFRVELPIVTPSAGLLKPQQPEPLERKTQGQISQELIEQEIENLDEGVAPVIASAHGLEPSAVADDSRTTILIIEDNPDMQQYIASVLGRHYHCEIADNGRVGMDKAVEIIPDLIVSDVMMPVMDGYESTRLIKEDQRTSHIPVIMLTARGDQQSRKTGWKSLADEYLSKPFDEEELELRVSNLLSIRKILQHKFAAVISEKGLSEEGLSEESLSEEAAAVMLNEKDAGFITRLNEVLAENYHQDSFSVNEMAEALFMSRRQLLRKLKALVDFTPQEYLRNFRLQKSAILLQQGQRISEVALASGFSSQSHFSTCFKAKFEMTPKSYQLKHR